MDGFDAHIYGPLQHHADWYPCSAALACVAPLTAWLSAEESLHACRHDMLHASCCASHVACYVSCCMPHAHVVLHAVCRTFHYLCYTAHGVGRPHPPAGARSEDISAPSPGTMQHIARLSIASPGTMWRIAMLSIASPGPMWRQAGGCADGTLRSGAERAGRRAGPHQACARSRRRGSAVRPRGSPKRCHTNQHSGLLPPHGGAALAAGRLRPRER